MPLKVKVVALGIVAVAIAGGGYLLYGRGDADEGLRLYGNVDVRQVEVAFTVEGRLEEALVEEGDSVTAGQPLARMERGYFEDALAIAEARVAAQEQVVAKLLNGSRKEEIAEAKAQVEAAQARLVQARQEHARQKDLVAKNASPQRALDDAQAALDVARSQLKVARERLALVETGPRAEDIAAAKAQLEAEKALRDLAARRLADTDLSAPADGVIMSRVREPGAVLPPGATVYTLAKTAPVWVRAFVPEPLLGKVQPGTPARVYTDTRDAPYSGHVGYVAPAAEFTPKSVQTPDLRTDLVFRFHVVIDDADALLRQGMPVTVVIE